MTVQDIFNFLNSKFPVSTACDFDNVGVLVGDKQQEVKTAIIALDCNDLVVKKAINENAQLIVTHHPVIFNPLKNVLSDSLIYKLIKNNISVISMHTNLDVGVGGVNDSLANAISLNNIETVLAEDGYALRIGTVSPVSATQFAEQLKNSLNTTIKYVETERQIENVLICSGSGGNFLNEAVKYGCDAFVTADVKHNVFLEASHLNIAIFDAGHFETENVVIDQLLNLLSNQFINIKFITEQTNLIKNR